MATKEREIKNLIKELLPLLDLGERKRLIGLLEGMIEAKRINREFS